MRILIMGGTGVLGMALIKMLIPDKSNQIVVTSRRAYNSLADNISFIIGNAHDFNFIKSLLVEPNNRFDIIVDFMSYSTAEFKEKKNLFLENADQYVFLSSSRVYASSELPLVEVSPRLLDVCSDKKYLKTDEYALAKARQEDLLYNSNKLNFTIIRPYITYGLDRLQLGVFEKEQWLFRALTNRPILFTDDIGSRFTTLTDANDVAYAVSKLLGNKHAMGETFHITESKSYRWNELLSVYVEVLKENGFPVDVIIKNKAKDIGIIRPQCYYDRLYNRTFDNSKICRIIGKYDFTTAKEGLRKYLRLFLNGDQEFKTEGISWKMEGLFDKFSRCRYENRIEPVTNQIKYFFSRYMPLSEYILKI